MTDAKNRKIHLNGYIEVPVERLGAVRAALPEHIRLTRAETGCIRFDITSSPGHSGRFDVSEVFIDQASFDFHQSRTATSNWAKITDGIPRHFKIEEIL